MHNSGQITTRMRYLQDQNSFMHCWRSIDTPLTFIFGGRSIVTNNIANNGGPYFHYGLLPLHSPSIVQDASTRMVRTPLTLIIGGSSIVNNNIANKGGQYFDYGWLSLHSLWIMHMQEQNCWRSIETHPEDEVTSVSLSILPITTTKTFTLEGCDDAALWLPNV